MKMQQTLLTLATCGALALAGAVSASAHAQLVRATPAVDSAVKTAPKEVTIRFSEKLEAAPSKLSMRIPSLSPEPLRSDFRPWGF